ncbi:MAG: hypothetical protein M5R36_04005 [Deltaproteobacteria bacterium]|nr:hypothetical protein [Deltaproteobacteria bacterium]
MNGTRGPGRSFFAACAAFVLVRVVVVETAYDHLHNVDAAVYEMPRWSLHVLGRASEWDIQNYHLWSKKLTAAALVPFFGRRPLAVRGDGPFSILVSLAGFAALVHLMLWRAGPRAAAVMALLLIFPDRNVLKWSLTVWGGYSEVPSFAAVALWLWAASMESAAVGSALLAGMAAGGVAAYSNNMVYFPLTLGALTLLAKAKPAARAWRFAAGAFGALIPVALWLLTAAKRLPIMPEEFYLPPSAFVGAPSLDGFERMIATLNAENFFRSPRSCGGSARPDWLGLS